MALAATRISSDAPVLDKWTVVAVGPSDVCCYPKDRCSMAVLLFGPVTPRVRTIYNGGD